MSLKISRDMLMILLTHHQVMISFLDFIFPFGMQEFPEDFYFSGLREETRLSQPATGLVISQLGRSGRDIRLCYNLKSVERSLDQHWPWEPFTIPFDVEHGKAFWIIVKGSKIIKKRIQDSTAPGAVGPSDLKRFGSDCEAMASSLEAHLVLADWCDEEWRWYMNYLEERLHAATRQTLSKSIETEPSIYESPIRHSSRANRAPSALRRLAATAKKRFSTRLVNSTVDSAVPLTTILTEPPSSPPPPPPLVQWLEEKANEVSPVLDANIDILKELSEHYRSVLTSVDCPEELQSGCEAYLKNFEKRIKSIVTDLERQKQRSLGLLALFTNRKNMLYEVSNKLAAETSRVYAKRAQLSTDRMERMAETMFDIANKTQQETVSMRIITLVTLFFLPGTFISTIMSTDIIQFQDNVKEYQWGALNWYMAVTIPFMAATFVAWYGFYWWAARGEKVAAAERADIEKQAGSDLSVI
ncbi:hypothetical protein LSUE1_G004244 [Lachnellula suecica]|uniref:CorA-like transporter domain-containing protein n=1 Tax=Lachnellula suecica TaxID=602035 RepID=A0A8T9C9S9_9HELO|nr:hypothetical protein LSUE1_G004244 [Lachnellula suecica]